MGVKLIRIRADDNVGVAVQPIEEGEVVRTAAGDEVTAKQSIQYGFKVALRPIPRGEPIIKYGELIGHASKDITPGDSVHTHNVDPLPIPDVYVAIT
jgi:hypothetical protein